MPVRRGRAGAFLCSGSVTAPAFPLQRPDRDVNPDVRYCRDYDSQSPPRVTRRLARVTARPLRTAPAPTAIKTSPSPKRCPR